MINHRITEYAALEGTVKDYWVPALQSTIPKSHTICMTVLFKHFSNSVRLKAKLGLLSTISILEFHGTTDEIHTSTLRNFIPNSWK